MKLAIRWVLVCIVFLCTNVVAQESGRTWTPLSIPGKTFSTQYDLEKALNEQAANPAMPLVVKSVDIDDNTTKFTYWHGVWPPAIGDWGNYKGLGAGSYANEEAMVQSSIEKLNTYSDAPYCNPSHPYYRNATVQPDGDWKTDLTAMGGVATQERRRYRSKSLRPSGSSSCIVWEQVHDFFRSRSATCPSGFSWSSAEGGCAKFSSTKVATTTTQACDGCGLVGNPAYVATGQKYEEEQDFDLGWIVFKRFFQSNQSNKGGRFGYGWTHSASMRLIPDTWAGFQLVTAEGYHLPFKKVSSSPSVYESPDGSGDRIVQGTPHILYQKNKVTHFDDKGRMIEERLDDGRWLRYAYDPQNRLIEIEHATGRKIQLTYFADGSLDDARLHQILLGGSPLVTYVYDAQRRLDSVTYADGASRQYHYEDVRFPMFLTGITAESGNRFSTFSYDAKGRVATTSHAGGADTTTLSYTPEGGALVTDSLGRQVDYNLTPGGSSNPYRKVTTIIDSQGEEGRTYYPIASDFRRRIDTLTDRNGSQTKFTYSQMTDPVTGRLVDVSVSTEGYGTTSAVATELRRDAVTNRVVMTKRGASEQRYSRNLRGQVTEFIRKDSDSGAVRSVSTLYCEVADQLQTGSACPLVGLPRVIDGPRTDVADSLTYAYYMVAGPVCTSVISDCGYYPGDLWKVTDALGRVTEVLAYDTAGRPLAVKDSNGVVTETLYYPRGWVATVTVKGATSADDRITSYEYWPTGQVKKITEPDGMYTTYEYDDAQRLTATADEAGNRIEYTLNGAGNRISEVSKGSGGTLTRSLSRVYNTLGQLVTLADAQSNPTDFTYDAAGNRKTVTDALGHVASNDYDPLNRLKRTLHDVGGIEAETKFEYDANNNLTKVTDPKGLDTTYTYNGLGDQVQLSSPDTGVTSFTHDSAGNRVSQTDARGITTTYQYDSLNRLTRVGYPTTSLNVSYTYDVTQPVCEIGETFSVGRLTLMVDGSGSTQYCHDRFGQLVRKVQTANGVALTLQYAYTKSGLLQTMTYPDGTVADYLRNAHGQVTGVGVTRPGQTRDVLLSQAIYHPFGPIAGWTYGNGRTMQREVDLDYRQTSIQGGAGGLDLTYGYDAVGNVVDLDSGSSPAMEYRYDALGRLTQAVDSSAQAVLDTYAYDETGNRISYTDSFGTKAYAYPSNSHRLTSVAGENRTYDAVGNTLSIGTTRVFDYNDAGRMSRVSNGGMVAMEYAYTGLGERIRKHSGSLDIFTIYDQAGRWLGNYGTSGAALQQAIWLDDLPVGIIVGSTLHYIQPDNLGTPRTVIEPQRDVPVWQWLSKSEPFGNTPPDTDPDGDGSLLSFEMRLPGQLYDSESDQTYNYFRDYEPSTGRHPQSDPLGLRAGISTYGYVFSSPLVWSDPLGLSAKDKGAFIGCAIGGGIGSTVGAAGGGVVGGAAGLSCGPGAVACTPAGAGGGGLLGWTVGGAIGCASGATTGYVIGAIIDACSESEEEKAKRCEEAYEFDKSTCAGIARAERLGKRPRGAGARCYASATERYGNCLAGRDSGPLDTWNN